MAFDFVVTIFAIPETPYQSGLLQIRHHVPGIPWQSEQSDDLCINDGQFRIMPVALDIFAERGYACQAS
jgi:hypothetical protein